MAGHTPWRVARDKLRASRAAYDAPAEYRAWVTVPGIDIESEQAEQLLTALVEHHGGLGPVLSGTAEGVNAVVAIEGADQSTAAAELYAAVADGLRRADLRERYPTALELQRVDERDPSAPPS